MGGSLRYFAVLLLILVACAGDDAVNPDEPSSVSAESVADSVEPTTSTKAPAEKAPLAEGSLSFDRQLTPAQPFLQPYGVDVDSAGNVYVFDAGHHRVVVFDAAGVEVNEWGGQGSGDGQFESLGFGALAVGVDNDVYVVDNGNYRIQKFDSEGVFLTAWGSEGDGEGQFTRAIGVAVHGGEVFVTDDEIPFVQVFDTEGNFLRRFGGPGEEPGQFVHATGLATDFTGNVWVSDFDQKRVQRFDSDGTSTGVWQNPAGLGLYQTPEGIAADDDGTVLVTSYRDGELQILPAAPSIDNEWVIAGGSQGFGDGLLLAPVDVAIGPDAAVYVVDQRSNMVQRFVR